MILQTEFGRAEVVTLPLPEGMTEDVIGTYTASGRILVSVRKAEKDRDWYWIFTMDEDAGSVTTIYDGRIPQKKGANGIRYMCFADNRRVLLGDYVLECSPDLDHCRTSQLTEVEFPEAIARIPGLFMRWSEPIIAPDNEHVCFSSLTGSGAFNFLGRLVRNASGYTMEDVCIVSTVGGPLPDPDHPGYYIPQKQRGGEVKQFIRGGRGISLAGGGRSVSESCLQMLDSEETAFITDTLGYEETAIFSPDEARAICMSPRFSPATDAGVMGVVPLSGDLITRGRYLNVLYQYAIAGVRHHRKGNIGPVLIDAARSMAEGRAYQGVNLSDPEDEWTYYSPMSWHPDSTKALWNERTRLTAGPVRCRLRVVKLLDIRPSQPVPAQKTPDAGGIPYARPMEDALKTVAPKFPIRFRGCTGEIINRVREDGCPETRYDHYSEDGRTFYDGFIAVKAPENMFMPGNTVIESSLQVTGEHTGSMELRLVLKADRFFQVTPDFTPDETGKPLSYGFAEYDGIRREVSDMAL